MTPGFLTFGYENHPLFTPRSSIRAIRYGKMRNQRKKCSNIWKYWTISTFQPMSTGFLMNQGLRNLGI